MVQQNYFQICIQQILSPSAKSFFPCEKISQNKNSIYYFSKKHAISFLSLRFCILITRYANKLSHSRHLVGTGTKYKRMRE